MLNFFMATITISPDMKYYFSEEIVMNNMTLSVFHKIFVVIWISFFIGIILFFFTKKKKFITIPLALIVIFILFVILMSIYAAISTHANFFTFFWYSVRDIVYPKIW